VSHDYDEVAPLEWTPRLIAPIAGGSFVLLLGVGMFVRRAIDLSGETPPLPVSTARVVIACAAVVLGLAACIGGYVMERARQRAAR
jgi:hypothetical protein